MQAVLGPEIASFPSMKAEDLNAKHFVLDLVLSSCARAHQAGPARLKQAAQHQQCRAADDVEKHGAMRHRRTGC